MRQTVPVVTCDHDQQPVGLDVKSNIVTIELRGRKPVVFSGENCDGCQDDLEAALAELLTAYLRREIPERRSSKLSAPSDTALGKVVVDEPVADRTCPMCSEVKPTRNALGNHLRDRHQTTLSEQGMAKPGGRKPTKKRS